MTKEALLFGLNYGRTNNELRGCCNDARELAKVLVDRFGFGSARVIVDENPMDVAHCTHHGIECALRELAQRSWNASLEVAFISYSGHGSKVRDTSGDESDGYDEGLCPIDYGRCGLVIDDTINEILATFNPATRVYIVVDACHSGTILDLPCHFTVAQQNTPFNKPYKQAGTNIPNVEIVGFSGCRDDQTSADAYDMKRRQFGGALTSALLDTIQIMSEVELEDTSVDEVFHRVDKLLKSRHMTQCVVLSTSLLDPERLKSIQLFAPK